jgi:hypothetical protein
VQARLFPPAIPSGVGCIPVIRNRFVDVDRRGLSPGRRLPAWSAVAVTAAAMLAGCAGALLPSVAMTPAPPPHFASAHPEVHVGVLDEGWHTGLVLPAGALGPSLAPLRQWFPEATYLAFGWGSRDFYMTPRPGSGTALSALLPSSSVVFVRALPGGAPRTALPSTAELRWLCASAAEAWRLDAYLGAYLQRGEGGRPISVGPGPSPGSRFFASPGAYGAFHTCNTWTIAGLEFAGLPVSARGVVFAGQVMSEIRRLRSCDGPATKGDLPSAARAPEHGRTPALPTLGRRE